MFYTTKEFNMNMGSFKSKLWDNHKGVIIDICGDLLDHYDSWRRVYHEHTIGLQFAIHDSWNQWAEPIGIDWLIGV